MRYEYSKQAVELVKQFEALRLQAYRPHPKDKWTIGWGHTRGVRPRMVITEEMAEELLREDMDWALDVVNTHCSVPLNQNQVDALTSLAFNCGFTKTLYQYLNMGDLPATANEFGRWIYSGGKILQGLVKRRRIEKELFLRPVQQKEA